MSTLCYVFTGLHHTAKCAQCHGTGICPECGLLPEGTDCGLCGRDTPKYACEACWWARCEECGGHGCKHCRRYGYHRPKVTRVGPLPWCGPGKGKHCADCGRMGYTTGCEQCGRVTVEVRS